MKAKIIKIGNSRGIRIPKDVIEQVGFEEEVVLEATRNSIVIRPSRKIRMDWEKQFRRMAQLGDDKLLDSGATTFTSWDKQEWAWK